MADVREGSAPNFAPPVEEGLVVSFQDENGDVLNLEFLGLIIHKERRYGFFFPVEEDDAEGEVVILQVVDLDEDGQPLDFEIVEDEALLQEVYEDFREATKDIYCFS